MSNSSFTSWQLSCTCSREPAGSTFCDPSCPAVTSLHEFVFSLPPKKAIEKAAEYPPSSPIVNALVAQGKNIVYRRAGLPQLFLAHILGEYNNTRDHEPDAYAPHWRFPAIGLSNVLAGILRDNTEVEEAATLEELRAAYPRIIDIIWRDIHYLKVRGGDGDVNRIAASNLIRVFIKDRTFKRMAVDEKTITIIVLCWLETSPDNLKVRKLSRIPITDAMSVLFSPLNEPPPRYFEFAFKAFNMANFMSQANSHLKDKNLTGQDLDQELGIFCYLSVPKEPFVHHFVKMRAHRHIMASALRALKSKDSTPEFIEQILESTATFTYNLIKNARDPVPVFTDLLAKSCMAEVGAAGFKITSQRPSKNRLGNDIEPWYDIFDLIWHCITCETPHGRCLFQGTPVFMDAAKCAFEPVAIPVLRHLQTENGHQQKYIRVWSDIITKLGMTGESIRERHRAERKCCNIICPARIDGRTTEKKMTCSNCQSVYYCDRICQKEDWKNHKGECKEMAK